MKHILPKLVYPPLSQTILLRSTCKLKLFDRRPGELKITLPPVQSHLGINFFLSPRLHLPASVYPPPHWSSNPNNQRDYQRDYLPKGRMALRRSPALRPPSSPRILAAWVSIRVCHPRRRGGPPPPLPVPGPRPRLRSVPVRRLSPSLAAVRATAAPSTATAPSARRHAIPGRRAVSGDVPPGRDIGRLGACHHHMGTSSSPVIATTSAGAPWC